ncbi:LPXTG cell wall anchor domain-containing protein [Apilactobacillus nanyangensis]|uniref:LPXTG cell wall anchor domain-containing protein n=1 Tax=Apilactobacillus nanyangensis TaxID=2799579 RepID=UPI0019451960|nr:LPXTG cell wall anchor domain-containing protein [Apilactobacillus nanyangensis]
MKQSFNGKILNKSKISKKWIYAAAITGVLITGAKAAQNTDNGSIDAKAATTKKTTSKATSVVINIIDDRGIQVYPDGLTLRADGKGKFDLSTLYANLTGGTTQYDASEVKAAMDNNTVDGSQNVYTFHVRNLTNPVTSGSSSQPSSTTQNGSSDSSNGSSNNSGSTTQNGSSDSNNGSSSNNSGSTTQNGSSDSNNGSSNNNSGSTTQSSASDSNNGSSSNNSGSTTQNSASTVNATKLVHVFVYNASDRDNDNVTFDVNVPSDSTILDLKNVNFPGSNLSIYNFMIQNWKVDAESIATNPAITTASDGSYHAEFPDYHIKTAKTIQFVDANNTVASSQTVQANTDAPYNISSILNSVPSYLVLDASNPIVQSQEFRATKPAPETFTINVNYQKTLRIFDDNNKDTGKTLQLISPSSTMTGDQFKAALAKQGYQLVNDGDIAAVVDFTNGVGYNIKLIKKSLPISFVDQKGNVVYSTNLPYTANNQSVSISDVLSTVRGMNLSPDANNQYVSSQQVPTNLSSVQINVTAPTHKLTINFVDRSTGNVVSSLEEDGVTDYDNFSITDKVNELKSQNYAPEVSTFSSQFNSQSYDNFNEKYVVNPAIQSNSDGSARVATIYVDSTVATPSNANKTGKGYQLNFTDANGNPVSLTINSTSPTMTPDEFQSALAAQGYKLTNDEVKNLGSSVDLTNANTGLKVNSNTAPENVYQKTISYTDENGNTKSTIVNINSAYPTISSDDLAKQLAEQGYKLSNYQPGQNIDLTSKTPIAVTLNADTTTKSYPQSLTYTDGNGQTHDVSVSINSKTSTMSKSDYINALADKGYTLTEDQKNKLSDPVDLSASTTPLVITNTNAQTSYTQTLKDDKGNDVTVHINSQTPQISADDYKKQLEAQGVKLLDDAENTIGTNSVDLTNPNPGYTVTTSTNANKATAYQQTVNVKQEDGSYKPTTVSITSATSTMSKADYVKALNDLGYNVQNDEDMPATVDLTNANNSYKVEQPSQAPTSYQLTVVLPNGQSAKVNINSNSSTISKDDLSKELSALGYALPDNDSTTYPLNLNTAGSINVKPNAQPVTNYPQTVKIPNGDGTFTEKTVYIPSADPTLSSSEYVKAMLDNGYTISNPSALNDTVGVAANNIKPVVVPNALAHSVKLSVKQSDGSTKEITVNIGSPKASLDKSDFVNAVAEQGYTVSNMDSLPASVDLTDGRTYDATPNASGYTTTLNSSDGTKAATIQHDTPLITKQDLINQLKNQGLNVSDTGKLNDVLNLTNSDDMNKVASLIEGFTTYKMSLDVVGTGHSIEISGNNKTITKQDLINKIEADGYKLMNPDVLADTLDLSNPDNFKGLIISKAENVSENNSSNNGTDNNANSNSNDNDANKGQSSTTYSQDVKVAGSNDTVKVESSNKTMTKDEFVKYLAAKGYKVSDESKLPDTIDLTKPLSDIEIVSNKEQSSTTYSQDVKVSGSNKTIKVESSKKTMTKAEFVKYLASKGYKVADESKLPSTIDLTKSLGDIKVVEKKSATKKTTKKSNEETGKNASAKEVNGHRGQVADKKEAGKLPQTGDETNQRNLFGFGLISMMLGFILAIFGLRRKNK